MENEPIARLELATSSIYGLRRRLPCEFECDCGRVVRIVSTADFRFTCACGLAHFLRDSEGDYDPEDDGPR